MERTKVVIGNGNTTPFDEKIMNDDRKRSEAEEVIGGIGDVFAFQYPRQTVGTR